jgi:hypothetical protein
MSSAERQSDNQSREGVAGTLQQTADDGDYPESDSRDAKYFDCLDGCRRARFHALKTSERDQERCLSH